MRSIDVLKKILMSEAYNLGEAVVGQITSIVFFRFAWEQPDGPGFKDEALVFLACFLVIASLGLLVLRVKNFRMRNPHSSD